MPIEAAQIIPWLALVVSSLVAIRSEWRARQSTDEGLRVKVEADIKALRQILDAQEQLWRSRFDGHHDKLIIMEARLAPLFTVFDKRLAEMLHQPHPDAWDVDQLLEKYQDDPDSLSDAELSRLIQHIFSRYERIKNSAEAEDQTKALAATFYLAILDGQRATRKILRDQAARAQVEDQQRDELLRFLREAKASFESRPPQSFFARIKGWFVG